MHIDSATSKRNAKTYTRHLLRTSYRENGKVKKRTIANLSHCSDAEINAIRLALQHKDNLATLGSPKDAIELQQGRAVGAVVTIYQIAKRLGIVAALGSSQEGKLALWQVIARVIGQGSRLSAVRLAMHHAASEVIGLKRGFNEDHLYQNLSWLCNHQAPIEDRLFRQMNPKAAKDKGAKSPLFLYDVTSSYLEGRCNALGAFGYNRDRKRGKQQIVIGLLCDALGEPVSVEAFEGNTQDTATLPAQIDKVADRFGGGPVTLVGDRGMIKGPQIAAIEAHDWSYITALTKPQIETLLKDGSLQMSLFDQDLAAVELKEGTRVILRRNPQRLQEIRAQRADKEEVVRRQLDIQNRYLLEHPRAKVETACCKLDAKITTLKLRWLQVAIEGKTLVLHTDQEVLKAAQKLDGCYALKTNLAKDQASKEVIHDRYKDLALVEQAFRVSKTGHLEVRPIYVRSEPNTRGHVLVVMLAYKLVRELARCWRSLNLTVEEGIHQLTTLCAQTVTMKNAGLAFNTVPKPSADLEKLIAAAAVTMPHALAERTAQVVTRKSLAKAKI